MGNKSWFAVNQKLKWKGQLMLQKLKSMHIKKFWGLNSTSGPSIYSPSNKSHSWGARTKLMQ